MINNVKQINYGSYNRKSSEDEDRQILSLDSQVDEAKNLAKKNNLKIANIKSESKSAKEPSKRPLFEEMIKEIKAGIVQGIITWHPNRLSRNPIDTGTLVHLMDLGKLIEIVTPGQIFRNTPIDKFMFAFLCLQAKLENDNKGIDVNRGLRKKAAMGYPTGVAKIGYLNDKIGIKGEKIWHEDPIRFFLIKQLFEKFLSGKYSAHQIWQIAKDEMRLTTPQRKKLGGRPIALSYVYHMLADPIYAGFFYHKDESGQPKMYELNKSLKRIITEDEYWKIQEMLGKKGKPRPSKRVGLYNHFMTCAHCGGHTSPDFKFQIICSECKFKFSYLNKEECPKCQTKISKMVSPIYLQYVYYYCIDSKKRKTNCPESSIEQKVIDGRMADHFSNNLAISKPLSEWCIRNISEIKDKKLDDARMITEARVKAKKDTERRLNNLLDLRLDRSDLTTEEKEMYDSKEKNLRSELNLLKAETKKDSSFDRITEIEKSFDLMAEVIDTIKTGTLEEKKDVFYTFRSNLKFSGKKVDVLHTKWVSKFIEVLNSAKQKNKAFEPMKTLADKDKTEVFASVCPTLLRR